jgi:hypothetical protein
MSDMSEPKFDEQPLEKREQAELAAYADGSLDPRRAAIVAARISASPQLAARVTEQRRALAAVRAIDAPASASLRAALARRPRVAQPRRSALQLGAGLTCAAAIAAAVVVALPGAGGPSIAAAAALAERSATMPPPATDPANRNFLGFSVDGVRYPYWKHAYGWHPSGARMDRIEGHQAVTVFYVSRRGQRIGYTIVGGRALAEPSDAQRFVRDGTRLRAFSDRSRTTVTWQRSRHTCVLSGTGVKLETLLELAAASH